MTLTRTEHGPTLESPRRGKPTQLKHVRNRVPAADERKCCSSGDTKKSEKASKQHSQIRDQTKSRFPTFLNAKILGF